MGKFFKRIIFGAAVGWVAKTLQQKRNAWSKRPVDEIRLDVRKNLPSGLDEQTKDKIVDGVVTVVKGRSPGWEPQPPAAQHLTSPPPPHTPSELRDEIDPA